MKFYAGREINHVNFHAFAMEAGDGGKVYLEGNYSPAPHTEAKFTGSMDFQEALQLRDELDKALSELPCPDCDRRATTKTMEGFVYRSGLGRVQLVPALDGVACSCPDDVDQELVRLLNAGEVPTQLKLLPVSMLQVAACLAVLNHGGVADRLGSGL